MRTPGVEIRIVGVVLVDHVDDRDAGGACFIEALLQCGDDVSCTRHLEQRARREVILDHVDDDERAARGAASERVEELRAELGGRRLRRLGATERGEQLAGVANGGAEFGRRHHQHAVFDPFGTAGENERGHLSQLLFPCVSCALGLLRLVAHHVLTALAWVGL